MHQTSGRLTGQGGINLFYRVWEPETPCGSIVLVHGAAEHVGRYEHVAQWFAERGWAVWAMDHRGHGQSEGLRMYVDRFQDYISDLRAFVTLVTERQGQPVMIGHSMGGLIAYHYAVAHPETIRALVLSSPWFRSKAKVDPVQKALAPVMAAVMPRLKLATPIRREDCTRNTEIVARDLNDPLLPATITPRWYIECSRAQAACHTSMTFPSTLPVLFMQAGGDLLVDPEATREIFTRVGHERKSFQLYAEKYHEIFNDPGYEELFSEILGWLEAQGLAGS